MGHHHLSVRYGPSVASSQVTIGDILGEDNTTPASIDGFAYVLQELNNEFYHGNEALRIAGKVFTAVIALSFYKLLPTPRGTYIMPNVIQTWLLANIFFGSLAIPFIWRAVLIQGGSVYSAPIWICLVWMSIFVGVWHVAWGTSVTALVQTTQLGQVNPPDARKARCYLPPIVVNLFFILGLMVGLGVYAGLSGSGVVDWNAGVGAWNELRVALRIAGNIHGGQPANASIITSAIPNANSWLAVMTTAFWEYEIPWSVCLSLATITATIQTIASVVQVKTLTRQIHAINREIGAPPRQSIGGAPSTSSTVMSSRARKEGLLKVLNNVIFTSIALTLSMFGYVASCVIGSRAGVQTEIFHIYKDLLMHLYIIAMVYPVLSLGAVIFILIQTFDKTVLATKTASNQPETSASSGLTKRPLDSAGSPPGLSPPTSPNALPYRPQHSPFAYSDQMERQDPYEQPEQGWSHRQSQLRSPVLPEV